MKKIKLVYVCYDELWVLDEKGDLVPDEKIEIESFDSLAAFRKAYPKLQKSARP